MKRMRGGSLRVALLTISFVVCAESATAGIGGSSIAAQSTSAGYELVAYGPVQVVDVSNRQLVVLGQTIALTSQTQITASGQPLASGRSSEALRGSGGALVAIYGQLQPNGIIRAAQVDISNQAWVPGTTTVYVRGVVTQASPTVGRARIGSLSVDYTAGLFDTSVADSIRVGATVALVGTQFATGEMFASTVGISATTSGIGGSSTSGIGGSSTQGIGGSSTSGIGGSSTSGICGSSLSGIGGSSTSGIGGSSTQGIGGSSLSGIGGSSTSGIGGSSTKGIGGSSLN